MNILDNVTYSHIQRMLITGCLCHLALASARTRAHAWRACGAMPEPTADEIAAAAAEMSLNFDQQVAPTAGIMLNCSVMLTVDDG